MNLEELPLFNKKNKKIKSDYDFTQALDFDDVNSSFSLNRKLIDTLIEYCKKNNLDINHFVESALSHYLEKK